MPIGPNGPGNSFNPSSSPYSHPATRPLVPLRPQPNLRPASRGSITRSTKTGRSGRTGKQTELQSGEVATDYEERIDPTNIFRQRSRNQSEDTVTLSEYMAAYIDRKRLGRLLRIWAKGWTALFNWEAQFVKSYISHAFGKDRPQYVEARLYGYFVGGGF